MANKDYYQILGLAKGASAEDIKSAYRKLARQYHPDTVDKSKKQEAEVKFKEINEAYQILSDPQKKQMYDTYGSADPRGFGGQGAGAGGQWGPFSYSYSNGNSADFGDFDPFDVFESFFGFGGQRQRKGKSLHYQMSVEFAEAVFGAEKEVKVESGKVKVKIPQGARDGMELRFSGMGMPGPKDLPAGDLFITLYIQRPKEFEIQGNDILLTKEIDFVQASLGDAIDVSVVDLENKKGVGTAKLKIPAGTQPYTKFKLKGKGMPIYGKTNSFGDAYIDLIVRIPTKLNKKQKELLEEYAKSN